MVVLLEPVPPKCFIFITVWHHRNNRWHFRENMRTSSCCLLTLGYNMVTQCHGTRLTLLTTCRSSIHTQGLMAVGLVIADDYLIYTGLCVHRYKDKDKDSFIGSQEFVVGYSKAPEQPQSSARPICHSHTMTSTGREPATIRIAAYRSSLRYTLRHGRQHIQVNIHLPPQEEWIEWSTIT